jgi:predicted Fe-Mo cluster-binding NifX family protein
MKIVITSSGSSWDDQVDPRFGRADYLLLYDEDADQLTAFDNREIRNVAHGAGPKTAQKISELNPDILITGNGPGGNAAGLLDRLNLKIYVGANGMTVHQAYESYKNNKLSIGGNNA